jgi:hypothetical protein
MFETGVILWHPNQKGNTLLVDAIDVVPMMHWQTRIWLYVATVEKCDYHIEYVRIAVILKAGKSSKLKKKRSNFQTGREIHGS